jgi:hypothetical protein
MPTDEFNMDALTTERRNAIAESIHPISATEMNSLGEALFPNVEHPWREKFFKFLQESGIGVMQPRALAILKEIVDAL